MDRLGYHLRFTKRSSVCWGSFCADSTPRTTRGFLHLMCSPSLRSQIQEVGAAEESGGRHPAYRSFFASLNLRSGFVFKTMRCVAWIVLVRPGAGSTSFLHQASATTNEKFA
eukprot:scaffold1063_cov318-Pavlova_lutheri.AAC.14